MGTCVLMGISTLKDPTIVYVKERNKDEDFSLNLDRSSSRPLNIKEL